MAELETFSKCYGPSFSSCKLIPPEYPVVFAFVLILIWTRCIHGCMWIVVLRCACDEEFTQNLLFAFAFVSLKIIHLDNTLSRFASKTP